jgi:hypothetical protein
VTCGQFADAVVLHQRLAAQHGLDAFLPLAALIDPRVAQADVGAQIEHVGRSEHRNERRPGDGL